MPARGGGAGGAGRPGLRRSRRLTWLGLGVVAVAGGALVAAACMETRRALGEDCLKNEDCLSGVCSQLQCVAAPTLFDAQAVAAGDGETEATAQPEAGSTPEAGSPDANEGDSPLDGAGDGGGATGDEDTGADTGGES